MTALRPPPSLSRQVVPASNPFNPFGEPVAVDYSFAGLDLTSHLYETGLLRLVGGARGTLSQWEWEISGLRHREVGSSTTLGWPDPSRVDAAINSEDPRTALNLFSEGPGGAPDLLNSLMGPAYRVTSSFSSSQLSAFMRGPLFSVREQQAELALGGEWRHDAARFFESGTSVDVTRDITSVFSEIRLPFSNNLSLKIAARGDDYGDGERIVNPQYGLMWRATSNWLLRAAYSTSFRPPSLFELHMPVIQPSLPISDPLRGGEVSNVALTLGGNQDLEVVTARSFTAGFVFRMPVEMPRLRVSGSYWRVVMDDRIMSPIYQELLKPDSPLGHRVTRDPPSLQDQRMGWPGRVRSIDLMRVNFGDLETSGIDLDASLLVGSRWGCLRFDLAMTWVGEYLSRDMNQVLPLNRVGIANLQGTIPKWRAIGTLGWELGNLGISSTTTFVPSYQDADFVAGPLDRRIGAQTLVDLQAWLELKGDGLLDRSTLVLGARNALDETPEFAHAAAYLGHDASQSELTGRFTYFRFRKRF